MRAQLRSGAAWGRRRKPTTQLGGNASPCPGFGCLTGRENLPGEPPQGIGLPHWPNLHRIADAPLHARPSSAFRQPTADSISFGASDSIPALFQSQMPSSARYHFRFLLQSTLFSLFPWLRRIRPACLTSSSLSRLFKSARKSGCPPACPRPAQCGHGRPFVQLAPPSPPSCRWKQLPIFNGVPNHHARKS